MQTLFDAFSPDLNYNVSGWLVYDDKKSLPEPALVESFDAVFDDMTLVPYDNQSIYGEPDQTVTLNTIMGNLEDGAN